MSEKGYTREQDEFIIKNAGDMEWAEIGKRIGVNRHQARGHYVHLMAKFLDYLRVEHAQFKDVTEKVQKGIVDAFNQGHAPKTIHQATGIPLDTVENVIQHHPKVDQAARLKRLADTDLIEALHQQIARQSKDMETFKKDNAKIATFIEAMRSELKAFPVPNKIVLPKVNKVHSDRELIQVAVSSDHHAEETVNFEEMEGFNAFNFQVYQERIWHWVKRVILLGNLRRHEAPIRRLDVDLIGDILTGEIHEELTWTNVFRTPTAIIRIAQVLGQALMILSAHYEVVHVNCVVGNHGRASKKFHFKQAVENSFDQSIYRIVEIFCRDAVDQGRIVFDISPALTMTVKRFGWTFLLNHGTGIKSHVGTPWYGITRMKQKERDKRRHTDKDFDFFELGHFHTPGFVSDTVMNGSVIGPGEFSTNVLSDNTPPVQWVLFVDEEVGLRSLEPIPLKVADGRGHGFKECK